MKTDPLKILRAKGVPKYIAQAVSRGFRLLQARGILKLVKKRREIGEFIMDYLERAVL